MRDKWKFWYSMCKDSFGMTFDGTAFKGKSEHGVRFTIQVGNDFLTIQTEASKTGYMLTDNFSSVIKGSWELHGSDHMPLLLEWSTRLGFLLQTGCYQMINVRKLSSELFSF